MDAITYEQKVASLEVELNKRIRLLEHRILGQRYINARIEKELCHAKMDVWGLRLARAEDEERELNEQLQGKRDKREYPENRTNSTDTCNKETRTSDEALPID